MGDILSAIEGAINGFLSNPYVQLAGRAILLYLVLLWLASAYWAYRDLQSRTANPIAPYLAAVFIILFTPFLFVFGILLYRLIRPHETVEEANERALAQEAMLREMQTQHCQTCGRRVEADWLICPYCRGRLRTLCPACSRIYELDWQVCAWCGIDPRALGLPVTMPTVVPAGPEPHPGARADGPADVGALPRGAASGVAHRPVLHCSRLSLTRPKQRSSRSRTRRARRWRSPSGARPAADAATEMSARSRTPAPRPRH